MVNKYRQMCPQYKRKVEATKDGGMQTKNMNNITYHWCPHHAMWDVHKPEDYDF